MSCHTTSWLGFEHFFIHLPYHNIKDHTLSHTTSLFSSLFMCQTLSRAVSCLHPSKFLLVIDWDVIWTWLGCQVLCSTREVPHNDNDNDNDTDNDNKFLLVIDRDVIWTWLGRQVLCSTGEVPNNRPPWKYRCQKVDWMFCQFCPFVCMIFKVPVAVF